MIRLLFEKGPGLLALPAGFLALLLVNQAALAQSCGIATFSSLSNELHLPEIAYGTSQSDTVSFSAVTVRLRQIEVLGIATSSSGQGASAVFNPDTAELKLGAVIADGRPYFDASVRIAGIQVLATSDTLRPDKALPWVTAAVASPPVSFRTFFWQSAHS